MAATGLERSSSFGSVAEEYDRFRPAPPMAAVDWVLQSPRGTVADIGAGTGALTRQLVQRVDRVLAVEPDGRMVAVLGRRSPEVPTLRSWAEHLPIRSGVLDAVTISSAWHWMDPEPTVAEVARVLRPGGVLGVFWSGADRSADWVGELLGVRDPSPDDQSRRVRHRFALPPGAPFEEVEGDVVRWSMTMTRLQLVGLAGTYSSLITLSPGERERELTRVEEVASAVAGAGVVGVPMSCQCWRAVRR